MTRCTHPGRPPPWWMAALAVTWFVGFVAAVVWLVFTIWPVLGGKMLCP